MQFDAVWQSKWEQLKTGTNLDGAVLGIDTFGASAPAPKVLAEYGFTVENLVKIVNNLK